MISEVELVEASRCRAFAHESRTDDGSSSRTTRRFCAAEAGTFEARFSTHGGRGDLALTVWRGERMRLSRREKVGPTPNTPKAESGRGG